jgi:hypothetical protein
MCVSFFSSTFDPNSFRCHKCLNSYVRNARRNTSSISCEVSVIMVRFYPKLVCRHMSGKQANIKFQENIFSDSRAVTCGQAGG